MVKERKIVLRKILQNIYKLNLMFIGPYIILIVE